MKNPAVLLIAFLPLFVFAQGFSPEQYDALASLTVENLERDTYVFFDEEGVILDRYELKPAYTFNFSDGIERKVYLYLVYPTETEDTLGSMLFYQREEVTVALPLPGAGSPTETWGKYIDDLKYTGEDESGFLACVGFVISKEFSSLLAGNHAIAEEEGEYEYCFPAETKITMADGSQRPINELSPGDLILGYSPEQESWASQSITGIDIHRKVQIPTMTLYYVDPTLNLSATTDNLPLSTLTLTPTHPVVVNGQHLPAGKLSPGMSLSLASPTGLREVTIMAISHAQAQEVYTLQLEEGAFLAEKILVWPK